MNTLFLIILLLLGMASILMVFIGFAFIGRRDDSAFMKGFYLSTAFILVALVLFFMYINRTL